MSQSRQIRGVTNRAKALDWFGRRLIAVGGIGIIAAVMGIFVFILSEAWPLFRGAKVDLDSEYAIEGEYAIGVDPYYQIAFAAGGKGIDLLQLTDGKVLSRQRPEPLRDRLVTAAVSLADGIIALGTDDGQLLLSRIRFVLDYSTGDRIVVPEFTVDELLPLDSSAEPLTEIAYREDGDGRSVAGALTETGRLLVVVREQEQGLLGVGEWVAERYELTQDLGGANATQILIDSRTRQLLVGTDRGQLFEWRLRDVDERPDYLGQCLVSTSAVTALAYILGEVSIVVGDQTGMISAWFKTEISGARTYKKVHSFASHSSPVTHFAASQRDKQFISVGETGDLALHHMTSQQTTVQLPGDKAVAALAFAPKADGFMVLDYDGQVKRYGLDNPHPEISSAVLFDKIWYEGYAKEEYVWQSTGGTDEFEAKISLIPLIFGTVKGTVYAMLFALPLAVLAAIYTSEFATPQVRNLVKPTVEVMASLPSVILGFLAGLWLAPLIETHLSGTLLLAPVIALVIIAAAWGWQYVARPVVNKVASIGNIYLLCLVTFIAAVLAYVLGPAIEGMIFERGFLVWLRQDIEISYDQRNCLVVGFAMGFAVVPLVFTICEDALSSVPNHLRAASLALGATQWQTAIKVVLPMALPGVFSAAMIGFGRAIGETMIVLMATGNTPIMDWNIFNGMRTISANIAVELPEAPHQGTLYRVLFLSGLLLFIATFCINSLAEVVRQRLRDKYNKL